jgi:hypothetical protein
MLKVQMSDCKRKDVSRDTWICVGRDKTALASVLLTWRVSWRVAMLLLVAGVAATIVRTRAFFLPKYANINGILEQRE